ncbi:MAG TPA: hypothetical protein VK191_00720 [Symbiobacteriaceae bacterium]|nr:hypothetical protein [Symbiobacteriaceae bacterium]
MVQEVMLMPRGMIAAPPMPQYGMPMNGQMPPPPPMMPPMPPMPPQPQQPQQQGAQPQAGPPQQADPWAGGINPSLTALLPQQGGAPGPSPTPYAPPVAPAWAPPPPIPAQQSIPASPPVKPTPIAAPGWAWPPATTGIPIDPGALSGVPAQPGPPAPLEALQELIPAEATLNPWRRTPLAHEPQPTDPVAHRTYAPEPSGADLSPPPEQPVAEPIPYYPTLAPAVPLPPVPPEQPQRPLSTGDGTYSTRAGRYARKIL